MQFLSKNAGGRVREKGQVAGARSTKGVGELGLAVGYNGSTATTCYS